MKGVAFLATMLLAFAAQAAGNAVSVTHAWVRWLPGDLPAGGYATIENRGGSAIRLLGADSSDYAMVMLHRSVEQNGVERMLAVDGMDVPAHGSAALAPGGYHLMLMQARHAIAPGASVHMRLHFSDGSTIAVDFIARSPAADASGG
ncbi:MAG: copper chaperone PCu(A)C [Rudaea sp.]